MSFILDCFILWRFDGDPSYKAKALNAFLVFHSIDADNYLIFRHFEDMHVIWAVPSHRLYHISFAVVLEPNIINALTAWVHSNDYCAHGFHLVNYASMMSNAFNWGFKGLTIKVLAEMELHESQGLWPLGGEGQQARVWSRDSDGAAQRIETPLEVWLRL